MRVPFQNQSIHLEVHGSGPDLLICLHGYGNTAHLFQPLIDQFPAGIRTVTFDLPGMGTSGLAHPGKAIPAKDWHELLSTIITQFPETERVFLMGYSIGARIALHWFQQADIPITKVILIAADGLRLHPLYRFCVKNPLGRGVFRLTLRHPKAFLFLLRMLYNLKLLDRVRYRWISTLLNDKREREQLLNVWLGYRCLGKDMQRIQANARKWNTQWLVIGGKKDRVIKPKFGIAFAQNIPGGNFQLIEGGHYLLKNPSKKLQELIDNLLRNK